MFLGNTLRPKPMAMTCIDDISTVESRCSRYSHEPLQKQSTNFEYLKHTNMCFENDVAVQQ